MKRIAPPGPRSVGGGPVEKEPSRAMPNVMHDLGELVHASWMGPAGRLIWASILTVIGLIIGFYLLSKPKSDRPVTWAQAMLGAIGMFALFMLCYGIVPSEWITFSDKYLQWNTTKFVFQSHQKIWFLPVKYPFDMNAQAIRDIIVVLIYAVFFGLTLKLISDWQKRGTEPAKSAPPAESRLSRFGRPLRRSRRAPAPVTSTTGAPSGNGDS
jgi:multidrug transporter EmrE-like cation transporter